LAVDVTLGIYAIQKTFKRNQKLKMDLQKYVLKKNEHEQAFFKNTNDNKGRGGTMFGIKGRRRRG